MGKTDLESFTIDFYTWTVVSVQLTEEGERVTRQKNNADGWQDFILWDLMKVMFEHDESLERTMKRFIKDGIIRIKA